MLAEIKLRRSQIVAMTLEELNRAYERLRAVREIENMMGRYSFFHTSMRPSRGAVNYHADYIYPENEPLPPEPYETHDDVGYIW